ncbi:hypothetical protein C8R45DRAFT_604958 [Mycena sanguinolenta]|nr:hypothetical protein C8R45DRAFT_604958 [Mycena sanguinolenta]
MHHNPSRMVRERRQAPSSVSPSASAVVDANPPSFTSAVNLTVPTSTTVLAVIVCVLALIIILGVGIWMFRRRRNAKKNTAPSYIIDFTSEKTRQYQVDSKLDLHASAYGLEKPTAVYVMPGASTADMNPNWVPQLIPNRGADLESSSSKKSKKSKKSLRSSRGWDKTFSKFAPSERSPPPSYMVSNRQSGKTGSPSSSPFASQIPLPPSPPHQSTLPPTPPTPPASKKLNPISPPAIPLPMELPPQAPLPSPARSASFAQHQSAHFAELEPINEANTMPRLMTVVNSFIPTLEDELSIQIGDTVRLIEEFHDGWALVQCIGVMDAPKGVVPRTCITDRERSSPTFNLGRRL